MWSILPFQLALEGRAALPLQTRQVSEIDQHAGTGGVRLSWLSTRFRAFSLDRPFLQIVKENHLTIPTKKKHQYLDKTSVSISGISI